jgi:LCP family protein required for cell wall assembly
MRYEPEEQERVEAEVKEPVGSVVTALLVGADQREGWDSARADTIVFMRADRQAGKAYMISIPRDTRVNIPDHGMDKINHAWAFGKAPLMIETVSDFLGLPINYVFQVDFTQFEQAVDALGGVEFPTDVGWTDGELGVTVESGLRLRGGKEALAIIRNRSWGAGATGSDLDRVGVQQEFIKAMVSQSMDSYADVPTVANVVASYVNTNMGLTEMLGLGRAFTGAQLDIETATLPGAPQMIGGVSFVVPDEAGKDALIAAMLENLPLPLEE